MMTHMLSSQEEAKLEAMQRAWQSKRGVSLSLLEDVAEAEEVLLSIPTPRQCVDGFKATYTLPRPSTFICSDVESDTEIFDLHDKIVPKPVVVPKESPTLTLNAADLGDIPARYTICAVELHQMPVIGVYIDKRVVPGFKYRVRPLPQVGQKSTANKCLFDNRALTLTSIGRGYARRITFKSDELNDNKHYFWSDNRSEGYAFELELISRGDRFTIFDATNEAQGTIEILDIQGPQIEVSNSLSDLGIEKRAKVKFTGKVEFYETGVAKPMPLTGTVVAVKRKGKQCAEVIKVSHVIIKKQRYTLIPGIQKTQRRVTVKGTDVKDIPTKYTMTGLEDYEIPVVGTYVDPRIVPGFCYKVRPNDRKDHLFSGRALKLVSIGMGYAKRLTFQPDSLVEPDNFLWSDNQPDGLGLEIRAIHKGMKFTIMTDDQVLGEASVFRADRPQKEEKMEKVLTKSGKYAVEKYIHIDVMCHIHLVLPGSVNTAEKEKRLMRVYGLAVVRKEPDSSEAKVIRVENVALDSQLNLLFAQTHTELTFLPRH